jgi:Tfp pilus assembly protein PilN
MPRDASRGNRVRVSLGNSLGAYVVLAVLAVMVAMTGAWAMAKGRLADTRTELVRVQTQASSAEAKAAALKPYVDFAALPTARIDTIGGLLDARVDWSRNLRDLGRVIPRNVSVTSLVGTASPDAKVEGGGGQSLRGASAGPAIDLVGCARTQAQVADLLIDLRAIDGVERVSLASSDKSDATAANDTECRANDQMPQFMLTIAYAPLPAAVAAAQATAISPPPGAAAAGGEPG